MAGGADVHAALAEFDGADSGAHSDGGIAKAVEFFGEIVARPKRSGFSM